MTLKRVYCWSRVHLRCYTRFTPWSLLWDDRVSWHSWGTHDFWFICDATPAELKLWLTAVRLSWWNIKSHRGRQPQRGGAPTYPPKKQNWERVYDPLHPTTPPNSNSAKGVFVGFVLRNHGSALFLWVLYWGITVLHCFCGFCIEESRYCIVFVGFVLRNHGIALCPLLIVFNWSITIT